MSKELEAFDRISDRFDEYEEFIYDQPYCPDWESEYSYEDFGIVREALDKNKELNKEDINPNKYLIVENGFDNMENHNPHYTEIVGVVSSKTKAEEIINRLDNNTEKYKGWDGKIYPQFKIEEIKSLDNEK